MGARSASPSAVQLARGSLQGASGRCHAKTAQRAEAAAVESYRFCCMLRVHFRCVSCIVADTSEGDVILGTRKQYMVGNFGPGVPDRDIWL
jgi:hypothetical protein